MTSDYNYKFVPTPPHHLFSLAVPFTILILFSALKIERRFGQLVYLNHGKQQKLGVLMASPQLRPGSVLHAYLELLTILILLYISRSNWSYCWRWCWRGQWYITDSHRRLHHHCGCCNSYTWKGKLYIIQSAIFWVFCVDSEDVISTCKFTIKG